jgi:peroxiredoxin
MCANEETMVTRAFPKPRERLPNFTLPSSEGRRIALYDYHGRRNVVLALVGRPVGEAARARLTALAARYAEFLAEEAEVLAVVWGAVGEAERVKRQDALPFPVLADEAGALHSSLGALASDGEAAWAFYITDRFGEVFAAYRAGAGRSVPTVEEMLEWLRFIGLQCPECGVSEWPA